MTGKDLVQLRRGNVLQLLNGKIVRIHNLIDDKIIYKGSVISRFEIEKFERLENIKNLDNTKMYYVQDARSYVGNAMLFWALNGRGYTTELSRARKYSYDEIQKFDPRETDIIWESKHIEAGIKTIVDMQRVHRDFSI